MKKWIMTMADDPEAMRYGFDGFGYKYVDSGSGSDWRTRHPDAEPLYASQPTQSDAVLDGDAQTILYLLGVRHGREDERAKVAAEALIAENERLRQPKTVTFTVVSAADGNPMHTFKIDPTKKTILRPLHSMIGYVFEPEGSHADD
jgi:hypothetical protein